ncbi:MAG TPA: hypothetical protein VGN03_03160, partial [Steroidobacteraceae bacterium]
MEHPALLPREADTHSTPYATDARNALARAERCTCRSTGDLPQYVILVQAAPEQASSPMSLSEIIVSNLRCIE